MERSLPSTPTISSADAETDVYLVFEMGLEDHVLQIRVRSENAPKAEAFEGKARDETEHDEVAEEAIIDDSIGLWAGRMSIDESNEDLTVVFARRIYVILIAQAL